MTEAQTRTDALLGFSDAAQGGKLGIEKLRELAAQIPGIIAQNGDIYGTGNQDCLERLANHAASLEVGSEEYLAGKIQTCLILHNVAIAGDTSPKSTEGFWRRELADY